MDVPATRKGKAALMGIAGIQYSKACSELFPFAVKLKFDIGRLSRNETRGQGVFTGSLAPTV